MQIKNSYFYFQNEISPEQCQQIIDLGKSQIQEDKARGINTDGTTGGNRHKQNYDETAVPLNDKTNDDLKKEIGENNINNSYVRDSEVAWLSEQWMYDLVQPYIAKANKEAGWNFEWDCSEQFQFTVYKPGGFYGWHSDCGICNFSKYKRAIPGITPENNDGNYPSDYSVDSWRIGKIRKLSVTINLNAPGEYEGGNLKFDYGPHSEGERYHECTEIRPQGSIIVFPSFIEHQVTPVTKGTRYSLVLWSLGKPFK